jgi:hypothetical protein
MAQDTRFLRLSWLPLVGVLVGAEAVIADAVSSFEQVRRCAPEVAGGAFPPPPRPSMEVGTEDPSARTLSGPSEPAGVAGSSVGLARGSASWL